MTKTDLTQKISDLYINLLGSNKYFDFVLKEIDEAIIDFEKTEENYLEKTYSHVKDIYFPIFIKKVKEGHSGFWANKAATLYEEFEDMQLSEVYKEILAINKLWAKNELFLHCKNNYNTDPLFLSYFEVLMTNVEGFDLNNSFGKAEEYKNKYTEAISKGKSLLYASLYASKSARLDNSDSFCDAYAYTYEQAYILGKSLDYCEIYAEKFGDLVVDKMQDLELILNDEHYYFYLTTIIGEMQALEYLWNREDKSVILGKAFIKYYTYLFEDKNRNLELTPSIKDPIDNDVLQKTFNVLKIQL